MPEQDKDKKDETKMVNASVDSVEALVKILTEVARRSAASQVNLLTEVARRAADDTKPGNTQKKEPGKVEIKIGNRVVYRDAEGQKPALNILKNKPDMVKLLTEKMQQPAFSYPSEEAKTGSISIKVNDEPVFTMQDGIISLNHVATFEQSVIDTYLNPNQALETSQTPLSLPGNFLDLALAQQPEVQRAKARAKMGAFRHVQRSLGEALPQNLSSYLDSIRNRLDPSFQVDLKAAEMIATAKAVLNSTASDRFVGRDYTFEQKNHLLTVTSHERGVILKQENGVITSTVSAKDIKVFNTFHERYGPHSDQAFSLARNASFIVNTVGSLIEGTQVYETRSYRIEQKGKDLQVFSGQALLLVVKNGKLEQSTFTSKDADAFKQLAQKLQSLTQTQSPRQEISSPSVRR